MLARLDQLERQLAEERDARLQLERKVTILCEEVAKHPWRSSSALGGQYPGHLFGMPTTSAESLGLPPDSDLQPPSYLSISEYALAEGAMPLDADDGLIAKMMADLKVEPVTNKINQLQEWCMSPSRRHPLPDYGECRPAPSGAGWESTVKIFDLQGQLILQESATAATKREAEMAAAHSALSSIH
mmetsp:Transcript_22715/g.57675  ORF Transcript_22715/g.57675 Transcript_22715/m.57675 type:complete len:186 (+) Transcript_22715:40-597(+)